MAGQQNNLDKSEIEEFNVFGHATNGQLIKDSGSASGETQDEDLVTQAESHVPTAVNLPGEPSRNMPTEARRKLNQRVKMYLKD